MPLQELLFSAVLLWGMSTDVYAEQGRLPRKPDPAAQLLNYYRKYPERYIRITDETWKYDQRAHSALHSLTLKNTASASYYGIEVRFEYQT